jgi:cysteine desulfurase
VGSAAAHPSITKLLERLAASGARIGMAGVDRFGTVSAEEVLSLADEETAVVTLALGESVTGALQPIAEIGAGLRGATLHVDASQAVGRIPVDATALHADLLSFSAHKFGGPQGIGALVISGSARFRHPDLEGSQERGRRPGTEAVALAAGFGAAASSARTQVVAWGRHCEQALTPLDEYVARTEGASCLSPPGARLPHIRLVAFEGCPGDAVLAALDARGIQVSTGTACTSGARTPPDVLLAAGHSRTAAARALRVSVGSATPVDEMWELVRALDALLPAIRGADVERKKSSFSRPQ